MFELVQDHLPSSPQLLQHTTLTRLHDVLHHHFLVHPLHADNDLNVPLLQLHVHVLVVLCPELPHPGGLHREKSSKLGGNLVTGLRAEVLQQLIAPHAVHIHPVLGPACSQVEGGEGMVHVELVQGPLQQPPQPCNQLA